MNRIGIAIRTSKGEFREFDAVLQDFVSKYQKGELSQVDYLTGINTLGGTRQKETLLALVENFDTVKKHQDDLVNATGSAKKMFEDAYGQSLDAKIQDLKRAFEQLYERILSSDALKYLITEATQLVTALSQVDGQTIAFIATVGSLVLVMSKLSKINKELIALQAINGVATGLTKFVGVLTGMIALESGVTGLAGAFQLLKGGIAGATSSAIAFMMTPIGMVITAIGVALGIAVGGFISYKQHQEQLEQQSKDLKSALDGVNESLKNGDTKGASSQLDKAKASYKELTDLIRQKNELTSQPMAKEGTSQYYQQVGALQILNNKIEEQKNVLKDAGVTYDETTGKVKEFEDAQSKIDNTNVIEGIKEQTKTQLENRENLEQAQEEFDNYVSTIQNLYSEYQTLSSQESLSAEQKIQLSSVIQELQGHMSGLNVSLDENGNAYISNSPLIDANIQKLMAEGMTVDNLSAIRISDAKVNSEWQIGNTQVTYSQITARIAMYKAEIQAIQALMQAKIANSVGGVDSSRYQNMSIGEAQSIEANSEEYAQYEEKAKQLREYENAKKQIDSLYAGVGSVPYSGGGGASIPPGGGGGSYMPSGGGSGGGKSAESEAKKAEQELIKSEKETISKITEAYDDAKAKIEDTLSDIDYNIEMLGEETNDNFPKRIEYTTEKIKQQGEEVNRATEQLMGLESTTVTTEEAQKSLSDAIQKANKELRSQKLEVVKLTQELQKQLKEQEKLVLEQEKSIAETTLESKQADQLKQLEDYTLAFEKSHEDIMNAYDEQLKALEDQNEEEERANELQEQRNDLKQKEIDLERLKNQKTIQTFAKDDNGNWNFSYTYDTLAVEAKQKEVDEAQKTLDDTIRQQELEDAKAVIEAQKTAEEELYKKKKEYLDKYSDDLKEQQDLEKQRLDEYYSDMDKLAFDRLQELSQQYGDNWDTIATAIQTKLTETQDTFKAMTTVKLNFGLDGLQEALNSSDLNGYLIQKRDEINKNVQLDLNGLSQVLDNINKSSQELSKTYDDILAVKDKNEITYEDVLARKNQVSSIVTMDSEGLETQLKNLQDINLKLENEKDSHYNKELERQNKAQQDELDSLKKFTESYLVLSDKFLELLQVVYDFRFNNITTIVSGSVQNILEALIQTEANYEVFAQMWNKMHGEDEQIPSSYDLSNNIVGTAKYQQSVSDYQTGKLALYTPEAFEQYYKQIGDGIGESLLSKLSNYSSSGYVSTSNIVSNTTNTSNSSSSTTKVIINDVVVQANSESELIEKLITIAEQKTKVL